MTSSNWEDWMSGDDGPREDNPERETMYRIIADLAKAEAGLTADMREAFVRGWMGGARSMADSGWDDTSEDYCMPEASAEALRRWPNKGGQP